VSDVAVIDLSGKITLGEGSSMVRRMIRELIDQGRRKILLNLEEVDYIDSAGIGEMVGAYTIVRSANAELKLINLTQRVKDLMQITRLLTVFDVSDDEAAAVRSFK
jgi:anti-sigma B factor antagonist